MCTSSHRWDRVNILLPIDLYNRKAQRAILTSSAVFLS